MVALNPINIILLITIPGRELLFSAILKQIDKLFHQSPGTVTKEQCTLLKFATAHEELYCHKVMYLIALKMILQQCSANAASLFAFHFSQFLQDHLCPGKLLKIHQRNVCHQGANVDRREYSGFLSCLQGQVFWLFLAGHAAYAISCNLKLDLLYSLMHFPTRIINVSSNLYK